MDELHEKRNHLVGDRDKEARKRWKKASGGIALYMCVCERVWEDVTYLTLSGPLSDIVESEGRVLQVGKDPQVQAKHLVQR